MEGAGVEHQPEARADVRLPQRRHVAAHETHLDAGLVDPLAGAAQGLLDDVDAGHLPAALGELDAPDRAAGAEVERRAVGRLAPGLLASHQLQELAGERRMLRQVLPRVEADRVGERVVHPWLLAATPAARKFSITTGIVCPRASVGLNSTISAPA